MIAIRAQLRASVRWPVLVAALLLTGPGALAQQPTAPSVATATSPLAQATDPGPRSGDDWIDAQIADIDVYGNRYRGAFVDDVVRYLAAPRELVAELLASRAWQPGDVYYACALAQAAGRPCRAAVALREQSPDAGWHAVADAMGVGDDRDALARLKLDITDSYRHWARPPAKPAPASVKRAASADKADQQPQR